MVATGWKYAAARPATPLRRGSKIGSADVDLGFFDGITHSLGALTDVSADHHLLGRSRCLCDYGLLVALNHIGLARCQIFLARRVCSGRTVVELERRFQPWREKELDLHKLVQE
jgi:hypothetical protein